MRREELVMDILGGLDDSFIEEAMPRTGKYAVSDSAVAAAPITLVETGTEISKKDLRIYWITRALGMAAVIALIVGAAVLLVQNWDKIAVSGNERPGIVTTVTSDIVTPDTTETDTTDRFEQITDTSMPEPYPYNDHEYYKDFYYTWINRFSVVSGNLIDLPDMEKQNDLINYYTLNRVGTPYTLDDNLNLYSWMTKLDLSVDNVCRAIEENNEYYSSQPFGHSEELIFNPYEIDVLKSGDRSRIAEAFATEYSIIIGDKVFNPEWLYYHTIEDYSAVGITPEEVLHKLDMYEGLGLTDEAWAAFSAKLQKYADNADPFGQITDTTMPRPFPIEQDYDHVSFESQWKTKAVGAAIDCRGRENYDEWNRMCLNIRTPYRLDDNNNVAGVIKQFGITSEEIDEYFEKRNAKWQESLEKAEESGNEGAIMNCRNEIFSDEEINALKSGNDAEIIALFMSDYSIWLTDSNYVISPEWLYYHTEGDYAAIGITPQIIAAKISLYEDTFIGNNDGNDMADESWELFKEKLTKYAGIDKEEKQQEQTVYAELPVPEKYYRNISASSLDELIRDFLLKNQEQFDMFWRLYIWGYNSPETTDLFRKYPDSENPETEHLYCKQDSSVLPFGTIDGFRDWMREYFSDDVYEQYRERLFDGWYQDGYYVPPYFIEENGELYRYGMIGNPKPEMDFNTAKVIDMDIRKISGDWSKIIDGTLWFACIGPEFTMPALNYTAYYGKLEIRDGEIKLGFIPCIDLPEYHGETTGDIESIWSEKTNENMKNKFADAAAELSGTMIEIDEGIEEPGPTDEVTIMEDDEF